MRCRACDCDLTDFEATRKSAAIGDYLDLCGRCLAPILIDLDTVERFDLYDPAVDILEATEVDETGPIILTDRALEDGGDGADETPL